MADLARAIGWTQNDVAKALRVSPSAVRKYFNGERQMTLSSIIDFHLLVALPKQLMIRGAALLLPGMVDLDTGSFPPSFAEGDEELADSINNPAVYLIGPEMSIMRPNKAFRTYFPWIPDSNADTLVNLPVEIFTNPGAKESFGDSWSSIARQCALQLRLMAPGITPGDRMEEILKACRQNPEFDRYLYELPDASHFGPTTVDVLCPDGVRRRHVVKNLRQTWPDPNAWDLFTLTRVKSDQQEH